MSDITVRCPQCSAGLKIVNAVATGQTIRCPKCSTKFSTLDQIRAVPPATTLILDSLAKSAPVPTQHPASPPPAEKGNNVLLIVVGGVAGLVVLGLVVLIVFRSNRPKPLAKNPPPVVTPAPVKAEPVAPPVAIPVRPETEKKLADVPTAPKTPIPETAAVAAAAPQIDAEPAEESLPPDPEPSEAELAELAEQFDERLAAFQAADKKLEPLLRPLGDGELSAEELNAAAAEWYTASQRLQAALNAKSRALSKEDQGLLEEAKVAAQDAERMKQLSAKRTAYYRVSSAVQQAELKLGGSSQGLFDWKQCTTEVGWKLAQEAWRKQAEQIRIAKDKAEALEADKAKHEAAFDRVDANKDGKLTIDELPERARQRFVEMVSFDFNKDGALSKWEFVTALLNREMPRHPRPPQLFRADTVQLTALTLDAAKLQRLAQVANLKTLHLRNIVITPGLELKRLQPEVLHLENVQLSPADLQTLLCLPKLKMLVITARLDATGELPPPPTLAFESLSLHSTEKCSAAMRTWLSGLAENTTNLVELTCSPGDFSAPQWERVVGKPSLRRLTLENSTAVHLATVAPSKHIEALKVTGPRADLSAIGLCTAIRELDIYLPSNETRFSGRLQLDTLTQLEEIFILGYVSIDDETLDQLSKLSKLRKITTWLEGEPAISDAGFSKLAGLPNLESLSFKKADLSDAALKPFAGHARLNDFQVRSKRFTPGGLRRMFADMPGVNRGRSRYFTLNCLPNARQPGSQTERMLNALQESYLTEFIETPLPDAWQFLRDQSNVNVVALPGAEKVLVTHHHDGSLLAKLDLLCEKSEPKLEWDFDDGMIYLGTPEDMKRASSILDTSLALRMSPGQPLMVLERELLTRDFQNVPLRDAMRDAFAATFIQVALDPTLNQKPATCDLKGVPLRNMLDYLAIRYGLRWSLEGNKVTIKPNE